RDDIQINTFICDYLGEVLTESNAENRGLVLSDEYLYNSDFYGILVQDKAITKTENEDVTYTLDARWYGNVARFLNHKCEPNLDKKIVFSDSQDYRLPRIAFFSGEFIKAGTELSYDYGYLEGNVQGKGRDCLCGSDECRRVLY
ncbi:hypothetical protein B484DRAFT_326799, partial [Ochromonadaceae sp. CCMP2298]